ncbi:Uncharacterized conserved protein GlcG, DUF336 family [Andreprevotia lacus DSM 23236]|uniref:Uncharacterized conserved protein GlcG, DUF336 family n=1 Tax=Andreprevotia lacus DSM 23236 TaxID=1121001 RepID=A0A1W1XFW6_9NEIS|nr:heme-binding protein [Andreprevotia lacus]SMC22682.1 Uncharacterized conserved protein GlcG, DUF336 family [Andreprevotia lacus DSM 23236]
MNRAASAVLLACIAGLAQGAPLLEKNISLADAQKLAADAVAQCQAKGWNVSVSIVDRAGNLKAFARADNAGPHTIAASHAKAYTSASAKAPTQAMMENAQKNPGAANLTDIPGFLLLGGGLPLKIGNEVIGAIGIGGAPAGQLDEQCALATLEANAAMFK